ncbi:hypothetical protein GCM10027435_26830 [Haloparvum alkalitolerans]
MPSWIVTKPPSGRVTSSTTTVDPPLACSEKVTLAWWSDADAAAAAAPAGPAIADTTIATTNVTVSARLRILGPSTDT